MSDKRFLWIDALRGIALLAILLDHTANFFPVFRFWQVWERGNFGVAWFIFLSGVTNSFRFRQSGLSVSTVLMYYRKKLNLFLQYGLATALLYALMIPFIRNSGLWDFISVLFTFRVTPPFYFFLILFQLLLILPLIAFIMLRTKGVMVLVLLLGFGFAGWYLNSQILFFPMFYPPYRLFLGGLYLGVFSLGMAYVLHKSSKPFAVWVVALLFLALLELVRYANNAAFVSIDLTPVRILYAVCLLVCLEAIVSMTEGLFLWRVFSFMGRNSLWIFLLHWKFIEGLVYKEITSPWVVIALVSGFVVAVGVLGDIFARWISEKINRTKVSAVFAR